MKNILIAVLLFVVLVSNAFAKVYSFRLFETSVDQLEPFKVVIVTGFSPSDVRRILVVEMEKGLVLFDALDKNLKISRDEEGKTVIETIQVVHPVNTFSPNPWGDTSVDPKEEYNLTLSLRIIDGEIFSGSFDVANMSQEEMCMWGELQVLESL